jgi:hypothetical protein
MPQAQVRVGLYSYLLGFWNYSFENPREVLAKHVRDAILKLVAILDPMRKYLHESRAGLPPKEN